jgi:molybdopterin converting factor small subunit
MISKMNIRKNLIEEAQREMEQSISTIDLKQLKSLYSEAKINISGIQKNFEDLVAYHNNMIVEKAKFITAELPTLIQKVKIEGNTINSLLKQEKELSQKIAKGDSFDELEKIIIDLNEKYRIKGEYESIIAQLVEVDNNINDLNEEIKVIDEFLFSHDFEEVLKLQIKKFNKHFSAISQELYGEKYALKYDKIINKNNQQVYKFSAFNANMSSGKKQGEILCFDLAYILFADEEEISCLHFLLNDKKELMHNNQLIKVADFIQNKNIQLVVSILKDKLPENLINKSSVIVELSQKSKLFKIEEDI